MIQYILQTLLFQLLFLVVYDIFHRKDTFFTVNRLYLLCTSLLSIVLPFIQIKKIQETIPEEYAITLPTIFIGDQPIDTQTTTETLSSPAVIDYSNGLLVIYVIGVLITIFFFVRKIIKIRALRLSSIKNKAQEHNVRILPESRDAFTFWNTIYIGNQLSEKERVQILAHEMVHLRQKHTLDLLWYELMKIVFWFNPMVYVYHRRIITLHEYISDAHAIQFLGKKAYYEQLLNANFQTKNIQFTNHFFNHRLLKKRIFMLQKSKSKAISKFKYVSILPLLGIMIIFTAFSQKSIQLASTTSNKIMDEVEEITGSFSDETDQVSKNPETVGTSELLDTTAAERVEDNVNKEEVIDVTDARAVKNSENKKSRDTFDTKTFSCINKHAIYDHNSDLTLDLKGSKNHETILRIVSLGTLEVIRTIHLKRQQEQTVKFIPKGRYRIDVDYGDDYVEEVTEGKCVAFLRNKKMSEKGQDILDFTRTVHYKFTTELHEKGKLITDIPFAVVDKIPTTVACKDLTDKTEIKKCVSGEITKLVHANFNTKLAKELGLSGTNKIYVRFKINSLGDIVDIAARSPLPKLEQEAIRVIQLLPKMIPGESNGKKVNVLYSLPIVFTINAEDAKEVLKEIQEHTVISDRISHIEGHNIELGYYLVASIFRKKHYLDKGIARIKKTGLDPKFYRNPKDQYYYLYLARYDTLEKAKKMLFSKMNNTYDEDIYILKIQ